MMAFYDCRIPYAAFYDIGIDGALNQKFHMPDLFGLIFKNPNKFFTDDLAFSFRFTDAL